MRCGPFGSNRFLVTHPGSNPATMRPLLRSPIVHFLIGGAALFSATRWLPSSTTVLGAEDPRLVVIDAAEVEQLRTRESARRGAPLSAAELDAVLDAAGVDEMLYREALRRGLDTDDAVVERRLVQDMRFLTDTANTDDGALLHQAQALGLSSGDPVIRRRLIHKMRQVLVDGRGLVAPTQEETKAFFDAHRAEFAEPPLASLSHIFFSGPEASTKASQLLAELTAAGGGAEIASKYGEPFVAGTTLPPSSEHALAKVFGGDFAHACMSLPVGGWSGPIASAHGAHLVWVRQRDAATTTSYELVRHRVQRRLEAEAAITQLNAAVTDLRATYRFEVHQPRS